MTDTEVLDFTSGAQVAEDYKKKEDAARAAARGSNKYFSLKGDQDTAILRFLFEANQLGVDRTQPIGPGNPHDPLTGWVLTKQHSFVDTKPAPRDKPDASQWPDSVGAICRRTPIGAEQKPWKSSCYICDNIKNDRGKLHFPSLQMWASAVLREEVIGSQELVDQGRIDPTQIGQKIILDQMDLIDEVDDKGTTTGRQVWKKRYVVVNMSQSNFFSQLTTLADYWGTILDRDYKVTRKGEPKAKKVEYVSVALAPYQVSVVRDGAPVVINYDLREPEIAALYHDSKLTRADIMKTIQRRVSDLYYARYFDIRVEAKWNDMQPDDEVGAEGGKPAAAAGPDAPPPPPPPANPTPQQQAGQSLTQEPTEGVTAEALAAMRDKVMGNNGGPANANPPAPLPAATPPTAAPAATAPPAPAAAPLVGAPAPLAPQS